ncbi:MULTISPECIES: LysM peptidoglycan-binding domain-containing protein [Paenibacillus]|uniref:LysM peptidoglycan-binding domain-containing protein n=1 Tax=Paenibacillus TaxID=44249 RepID=UPI0003178327|nr:MULTISPECIES: LysM peptidoglycan-binding domain-containing protein [Paenibacillus]KKD55452.1 terminase [Paenibacillus sp. ICGEB2008]MBE3649033.1 LysM peptidoglycan-binding domain-containing protein [Paenibacillus polymyxa]MDU8674856.1 LysM peptidoglycan-binding domain-containing protein [Paenibacillus polymyxa]MDU8699763.1 LysM peptidoglycan-binding domain-containing protein [Paenibacillus polymyxa]PTU47068.1 LysM peptidoglycan-binding domain-containing protein [Paenibacillus polymyxa]
MEFSLTDGKGKKFQFPVNPEEVTISRQKGFDTTTILSYGEFDFPQGEKVKEISFSSFFPKEYNPAYCTYEDIPDPQEAMNTLNGFLLSKSPLRFIITETAVNVPVIVASHNSTFRGGEYGDVNFDLSLRTWSEMKVAKKAGTGSKSATVNKKPRTDMKEKKKTYTVKSGDSLSKIAKLELGDSSQWNRIYQLNKKVIGKNPNAIKPGQKLVLS